MNSLTINIHSFVDLITNSSTEIFVQASDQTVKSVKKLIDELLKLGNSQYKCEDLFDIYLTVGVWNDDIDDYVQEYAKYDPMIVSPDIV
jgi:phosphoglycerate-specific signal transduction histidine kinase